MRDRFGRKITYLRISITDACNLQCVYCMPDNSFHQTSGPDLMRADEIVEFAEQAARLGIRKIRITGGEPLVRPDVLEICSRISAIAGVKELALTTNGLLLKAMAADLKKSGVSRINVSLDTLQTDRYRTITGKGRYSDVVDGIEQARSVGLKPIKINTVLIGGFNDNEIADFVNLTRKEETEVRFIELMPIGACASFPKSAFVKGSLVLQKVPELISLNETDGVARMYRYPGGRGKVGIISSVNQHFCKSCNRIRLTCDGRIKPCLHSANEMNIRGLHGERLRKAIYEAVLEKPAEHGNFSEGNCSETSRFMNQIGG